MQSISTNFNFQIVLQQLSLNLHLTPFKLKFFLKHNNSTLQSKAIQIKQKINALSETFCFDSQLPFKKSRQKGGVIYTQKIVTIKLIGNKVKQNFQIGQCRINLSQYANKNSFYYQNQIKTLMLLCFCCSNLTDQSIIFRSRNRTFSIPNLPSVSYLRSRKILAVSRQICVDDIASSHQTNKTYVTNKSNFTNKTYPEEQEEEPTGNYHLASKLQSLYNKLESIASTPSRINGIEVIKEQPSQLIESSVISSKNMDNNSKYKIADDRQKYQDLVKHLGNISQLENMFQFNQIVSESGSERYYDVEEKIR